MAAPQPEPTPQARQTAEYFASIQDENGVDLTLIRANLQRPALERLRRADRARLSAARLRALASMSDERRTKST